MSRSNELEGIGMTGADNSCLRDWRLRRDAESFAELVHRHSAMVYSTCKRVLNNASDAEDIAQECFMKLAVENSDIESPAGWLHRVAVRASLNRLRAERRRNHYETQQAPLSGISKDSNAELDELLSVVDEALAELPENVRVPIVSRFLEGRTHAEIGKELSISRSAVQKRIDAGLQQLRGLLDKRGIVVALATLASFLADRLTAEAAPASLVTRLGKLTLAHMKPAPASSAIHAPAKMLAAPPGKVIGVLSAAILISIASMVYLRAKERPANEVGNASGYGSADGGITQARRADVAKPKNQNLAALLAATRAAINARRAGADTRELGKAPTAVSELGAMLDATAPSITGKVTRADGTPVSYVSIQRCLPGNSGATNIGYTDEHGRYRIKHDGGLYRVRAAAVSSVDLVEDEGVACSNWAELRLEHSESREQDFVFPNTTDLVLHVENPAGEPISGVFNGMALRYPANGKAQVLFHMAFVNSKGDVTLLYLLPGRYDIEARVDKFDPVVVEDFEVRAEGPNQLKITTKPSTLSLKVKVLRPNGSPWPGLYVNAREYYALPAANGEPTPCCNLAMLHPRAATDANGECDLGLLWKGLFRVAVFGRGTPRLGLGEMVEVPRVGPLVLRATTELTDVPYQVRVRTAAGDILDHSQYPVTVYAVTADGQIQTGPACNGVLVPEGRNLVVLVKEGYTAGLRWLDVKPRQQTEEERTVEMILEEPGSLSGTVVGVSNSHIRIYPADIWDRVQWDSDEWRQLGQALAQGGAVDSSGRFTAGLIPAGTYVVAADADRHSAPVTVTAGSETPNIVVGKPS